MMNTALPTRRPLRVLVVDDCRESADTLALLLGVWGHDCRVAYDGPRALELSLGYQPEVVLLDLAMPRMDGHEVARRMRRQLGMGNALLAALTGYGREQDHRDSSDAGFDLHLVKPFPPEQLEKMLARVAVTVRTDQELLAEAGRLVDQAGTADGPPAAAEKDGQAGAEKNLALSSPDSPPAERSP